MFRFSQLFDGFKHVAGKLNASSSRRSRRPATRRLRFESLERREMMAANSIVLYSASTISTFANVGFQNNPVATLDAYISGKQDRNPAHFQAQINWGDQSGWQPAQVALDKSPGARIPMIIKGTHVYDQLGTHQIQVKVTGDGVTLTKQECAASVASLPLAAGLTASQPANLGGIKPLGNTSLVMYSAATLTSTQGASIQGIVATADGYYNGPKDTNLGDYKVQINWGDTSEWSKGQLIKNPTGSRTFSVQGSHVYLNTGAFKVTVQLTGPDGQTRAQQTCMVSVKADPKLPGPVLLKGSVSMDAEQSKVFNVAQQKDQWTQKLQEAVNDSLYSFADGLTNPAAKPTPISLTNPAKYPFSRSFFDAGRMLYGIAQGTVSLPSDMLQMAKNIATHPEVLAPGYPILATQRAIDNAVKNPIGTLGQILDGYVAFRDMDPAQVGGRSIPGAVLMGMFGPGSPLAGKIGTAEKAFEKTAGAVPAAGYGGMDPSLNTPTSLLPPGERPMSALVNQIRWAGPLAEVNPGLGVIAGAETNCANAAIATDKILAGASTADIERGMMFPSAAPSEGQFMSYIEQEYPGRIFGNELNAAELVSNIGHSGIGSRGIVHGLRYTLDAAGNKIYTPGHYFNVINNHGVITFLDGQTGRMANIWEFQGFQLLRTN